jgi:hypothetical protein
MRSKTTVVLIALAGLACTSRPTTPVPVVGAQADVTSLAGNWLGDYEADNASRHGSVEFDLKAGSDTAFGDVLMIPRGWDRSVEPEDRPGAAQQEVKLPQPLTIRFVQVSHGEISGELDRYRDPDCGCLLRTVFIGRLAGDTLSGRYESYHQDGGPPTTGRWKAVRRKSKK